MVFTAQQIADFLGGTILGNSNSVVNSFAAIEEAKEGSLSFLANPKYNSKIYQTEASVVLVNNLFKAEEKIKPTLIMVDDPYAAIAKLLTKLEQTESKNVGVSELAYVSPTAQIGNNVYIAPFAYVGDDSSIGDYVYIDAHTYIGDEVSVGNNTLIHAGVKVEKKCKIGANCIIQAGAVIGSDGFGFAPLEDGSYQKVPQIGNVVIEDGVEVGANTTIDRATFGSTIIRQGVKIDNLVQIAHNVEVGRHTAIAAQSGIAGSTVIGQNCILAGQVGVAGHIEIADGSIFGAQAGVANSVKEPNSIMQGTPAVPVATFRRSSAVFKNLAEIQRLTYQMKRELDDQKK